MNNGTNNTTIPKPETRELWIELHKHTYSSQKEVEEWYREIWLPKIPEQGCSCKSHWAALTAEHPPIFPDADTFFRWGVDRHNDINRLLDKPEMSYIQAYSLYKIIPQQPPLRKHPKKLLDKEYPLWTYITDEMLLQDTKELAAHLPPISGVAGVSVSGMDIAVTLAKKLHAPLYEASHIFGLRKMGGGWREGHRLKIKGAPILVIDDTCSSGKAMSKLRGKLGSNGFLYTAVYTEHQGAFNLDYYGTEVEKPHLLEWNLANTGYINKIGPNPHYLNGKGIVCDLDGVICQDASNDILLTEFEKDNTPYLNYIANAPIGPYLPRSIPVPVIVSWRCEYTREITEAWLAKHHIKYNKLILWQGTPESRTWQTADHKGKVYASDNYGLMIESDYSQALDIAAFTGKKVLCTDRKVVVG